ncbi:MAG: outer membrane protein assembly factor BamB [Pirellulaceae bacterium]|jgi:outer membrane protein assembly factor BamB
MFRSLRFAFAILFVLSFLSPAMSEDWPGWRGPRGDGSSVDKNLPVEWDGESQKNVKWKSPIDGYSHSSPIVWKDRIFVVSCVKESTERVLISLDRKTGAVIWQKPVLKAPLEKLHKLNSHASGTPVTDGKLIYVTFLEADFGSSNKTTPGNMVVAAFDFEGKQKWLVRPGRFSSVHGFCTSPIIFKDKLIVNGDHDGDAYIAALHRETGETIWKVKRENKTRSYVTPIVREIDGRTQMILSGSKCIASYDPNDGERHWIIDGPTQQYVASMVYNGEFLFMTAGFPERHILAIRPNGTGNVTDTHVEWRTTKACSYVPSPVISGDHFLVAADNGVCSCFDAASGDRLWMERLGKHYSASLVEANGLVYFTADDGIVKVIRPGKELDVVAENNLGEYVFASPAISDGQLFIRGENHLFCIEKKK